MKQVVLRKGKALVVNVQKPSLDTGTILVELRASCISPGTELSSIASSGKSLFIKIKNNPEKLFNAIKRMKSEGYFSVLEKSIDKHQSENPIGYSAAGVVIDVANDVKDFSAGMRVAVAGTGYATHSEFVVAPVNLAIPIPKKVSFTEASTCALGGIALQGIRRAKTEIGEIITVIGCGAIGLLTIQMLKANGCTVVAVDIDHRRLELAKKYGADACFDGTDSNLVDSVTHFTGGYGVDKVIITASTDSNVVLSNAFKMCRKKGRVVLVGVVGAQINRNDMYAKELDFVISTSYGPGRYDEQYERFGNDYPYGYVRWTEKRNMEAYLKFISSGLVSLEEIIEAEYPIDLAHKAYELLKEKNLILVTLNYPGEDKKIVSELSEEIPIKKRPWVFPKNRAIKLGIVGAGSFIQDMHIPNLKRLIDQYQVFGICNRSGLSARQAAKHFKGCQEFTDYSHLLRSDIDMVMIGTRHNLHAELAIKALEVGKAVFVEKPMCITHEEYKDLCKAVNNSEAPFMVGYNRRFSPIAIKIREKVENRINPLIIQYTMNAGYIPYSSWIHSHEGGGRIVGEACHIFDLFRFIIGHPVLSISVDALHPKTSSVQPDDNIVVTLKYQDGSIGTLVYTGIGSKKYEKENMLLFSDEQIFKMSDYYSLKAYGVSADLSFKKQEKGHFQELEVFAKYIKKGIRFPIPWEELKETWEITRQITDSLRAQK